MGADAEEKLQQGTKGNYYLSTTRSRYGEFHRHDIDTSVALLELDGEVLTNNSKGKAVDFYGSPKGRGKEEISEMEDRIFSRTQYIPAIGAIKNVSLYYYKSSGNSHLKSRILIC